MTFRKVQWLFPIALALHNSEEALTMPGWFSAHSNQIPLHPGAAMIWCGLSVLTVAAFVVTHRSAKHGPQSVWAYLVFGGIVTMLANVVVPHVPASFVFRGYTPGVATAALVNLPVMSLLTYKALRERWVSGTRAVAYAVCVPVALAVAIGALFTLTELARSSSHP